MRERKRNPDGKFVPMLTDYETEEEPRQRESNIVIKAACLNSIVWYSILVILWIVLSLPFTYHLFVKRNILKLIADFLEDEFGCNCLKITCSNGTPRLDING